MLHIKFQTSEHSGSEEKDFVKNFFVCLWFEPKSPAVVPSWTQGLWLNKLGKGPLGMQCHIPNCKHLSKVVLKKNIFLCISMVPT